MNKKILTLLFILTVILAVQSQNQRQTRGRHGQPILNEVSNQEVVQSIFPDAVSVEKAGDFWFKVVDNKKKTLGFALNSTDYCKDVRGHAGCTPVMIITDKKFNILKISLLSSYETPSYVNILQKSGFFEKWNGKNIKKAKIETVDGYTGATRTAQAVVKNINFLIDSGLKKLP